MADPSATPPYRLTQQYSFTARTAHRLLMGSGMRPRLITPADPHRVSRLLPVVPGVAVDALAAADLQAVDGVVEDALAELSTARFAKIEQLDPEEN